MGKIYTVGFEADIIEFASDILLKESGAETCDLSPFAVIFPGRRPQFYLRKALASRIKRHFFPPKIFSIEEFIQHLAAKCAGLGEHRQSCQPISLIDASFLIYKIIRNLNLTYLDWQKQLEFEHFFLWAQKIFQFLEELDKELISWKQLLNLQENAQIGLPLPDYINHLLENINQIHQEFHRLLEENKLTTQGFNYFRVAQSIDAIPPGEFRKIYFVGFFALNACEKKIIKHLLNQDLAVLFWQRDDDKWSIFEELEEFFGISPERVETESHDAGRDAGSGKTSPRIRINEGFDTHSQLEAVRRVLSETGDLEDTCLVLPQPGALMPLLYQGLPPELNGYNISLGYPLKRTPIYALIDMIMQLLEKKRQDESFYTKDYLKVIMHPYIKNIGDANFSADITRIVIHKVEEALLGIDKSAGRQKKPFIKLEEIEQDSLIFQAAAKLIRDSGLARVEPAALREQLKNIHQKFLLAFDDCSTLLDFVRATQEILYFVLEKSKVYSDIFSGETFSRFLEILDSLGNSLFKDEPIKDKAAFFELLKMSLSFEKIPFSGTPLRGLQILGLLETRNLKFRNLLVLDLNEGVLPKIDKGESLIPEGVFPILGLPHYHKKEQIMRYHFRRLLGSAENVFLFYAACSRNKESRSRFVEEIIWQEEKKEGRLYRPEKIKRIQFKLTPLKERFSLTKTPQITRFFKNSPFSASGLDMYLNCPARFYFHYGLRLREKEEITEEFEAQDVGNFLHSLLRDFYSLFLGKTVKIDEEAHRYLFELKEKEMKQFFPQQTGEQFLLSRIIDYKLKIFLNREANRKENIKILYLEQEFPVEPRKIEIDTEYGPAYLRGKLDRVDERVLDGRKSTVILDYKTGGYSLPKKNITRDILASREEIKKAVGSFQLPLYIYLFSRWKNLALSEVGASFYSLRDIKEEFLFGGRNPGDSVEICLSAVKKILSEILCPDLDFVRDDSNERYCRYCPFPALCKR
ncbi:MAG: PD-(D/E)XK nuclease family protein [Candidatus Omnitrophota bacterium]